MATRRKEKIKNRNRKNYPAKSAVKQQVRKQTKNFFWISILLAVVISGAFLSPMMSNGFTNWDDEIYVVNNTLLRGPDWHGIFTQAVSANYHPLTLISLVINYKLFGLDPASYIFFNYLLHLINTSLVFYFIWIISGKKIWVAFLTALVFGIHPMHVESVAWVSERKDVLYTLFFVLSLLQYWRYLETKKPLNYWFCFLFFVLSLLSKPAAIVLPLVLLLLDYWKGQNIDRRVLAGKIPFLILSFIFGVVTVKMQSHSAMAGLEIYPWWSRLFFACYVIMIYFVRFFIPYPLSAFHPYPSPSALGMPVLLSPLFILALAGLLWYQRKNRLFVFSVLFFITNLLLVLQIISIGNTIVSERYTYVPYIGLGFLFSSLLTRYARSKMILYATATVVTLVFGIVSFERTKVWKDSNTLWSNVIEHYPHSPVPRTNRANYLVRQAVDPAHKDERNVLFQNALEDCNVALSVKHNHSAGYEDRQFIYYNLGKDSEALADADTLIRLDPRNKLGYYTRGLIYMRSNEPSKALADFNTCISIDPDYDAALNNRGTLLVNSFQRYADALIDFNKAIRLNPEGNNYLNRSICYYKLGDITKAKTDAQMAVQKGTVIPENYRQLLKL